VGHALCLPPLFLVTKLTLPLTALSAPPRTGSLVRMPSGTSRMRPGVVVPPDLTGWFVEAARPPCSDPSAYVCCFAYVEGTNHASTQKPKAAPDIPWEPFLVWVPWRQLRADVGNPQAALDALRAFQLARLYAEVKDAFDALPFTACKPETRNDAFWKQV
jgi:hypothetical protein